eukprot:scaffold1179_cov118-Isochrysis_galbana.AAC.15
MQPQPQHEGTRRPRGCDRRTAHSYAHARREPARTEGKVGVAHSSTKFIVLLRCLRPQPAAVPERPSLRTLSTG